ncbi:MAG: aldo/keto reductase [Candidatus Lokiarchaeota archaeon]|nr:aldo/keto reductase [Candidatus Lokiarchaeota archaeon]
MPLPESSYTDIAPGLRICRVLNGMWQVSGAHGRIDPASALPAMLRHHDAGFTTWDLADHYGPAEDFIGAFRVMLAKVRGQEALDRVQALTKWVPRPGPMPPSVVEKAIDTSLRRMRVDTLDMLQFHWWDYDDPSYLEALNHLKALIERKKIKHLALTNFDTEHVERILDHSVPVVSNQVQYSIVDQRPAERMAPLLARRGMHVLAYGTLCGGLLSERYLGRPEPSYADLDTASLQKYKRMVGAWGGWNLLQELLAALDEIAQKHGTSIANVATRYVLDQQAVAGVIVGVRLGVNDHFQDNARVFSFSLDGDDISRIEEVTAKSNDLLRIIGDCGDEYRR